MQSTAKKMKSRRGFALIELLLVALIIPILIAAFTLRSAPGDDDAVIAAATDNSTIVAIESNLMLLRASAQSLIGLNAGEVPDGNVMPDLLEFISGRPTTLDGNPPGAVYRARANGEELVITATWTAPSEESAERIAQSRSNVTASGNVLTWTVVVR